MNNRAIFLGHLGLGDHIIQQAIVNSLAQRYERVLIFCKHHNLPSVKHMCGRNIDITPVNNDNEVHQIYRLVVRNDDWLNCDVFRVGMYNADWNHITCCPFDKHFYQQLDLDFALTYNIDLEDGTQWKKIMRLDPHEPFCFIHDDASRHFEIDTERLNITLPIIRPTIHADTIFDYLPLIRKAAEIHCIDSSFALMIDRANDIKAKKYIHRYARQADNNPSYTDGWELLR